MENLILTQIPFEVIKTAISDAVKAEFQKVNCKIPETKSEYITRKEAAKFLGISLPTLNHWSKAGIITSYRIGTRVRYKKAEVENSLTKVKSLKYGKS